jgi:hypothetical protein
VSLSERAGRAAHVAWASPDKEPRRRTRAAVLQGAKWGANDGRHGRSPATASRDSRS